MKYWVPKLLLRQKNSNFQAAWNEQNRQPSFNFVFFFAIIAISLKKIIAVTIIAHFI